MYKKDPAFRQDLGLIGVATPVRQRLRGFRLSPFWDDLP